MAGLAECGTFTAYKRHKRNGEPVDEACAAAARDQKNERMQVKRDETTEVVRLAIADAVPEVAPVDPLAKLRWNLAILEATMTAGVPNGMAALSKQHAELVDAISRLENADKPGVSALDQLAQRREARIAGSAS